MARTMNGARNSSDYKLYCIWAEMRQRCNNPQNKYYKNYGGRGIRVCSDWDSFEIFALDMGPRPEGLTLDREDNNRGYCKDNCRWISYVAQNRNRRSTKLSLEDVEEIRRRYQRTSYCRSNKRALAIEYGVSPGQIKKIILMETWI